MNFLEQYKLENDQRMQGLSWTQKNILALMCLERQFRTYAGFSQGQPWDRRSAYRELLDRCWAVVLSGGEAGEDLWYFHEKIRPDAVCGSGASSVELSAANIFAAHMEGWLDCLIDCSGGEETERLLALDFILASLNEGDGDGSRYYDKADHSLITAELRRQARDEEDMKGISCLEDARKWYNQCEGLLG